MEPTYNQIFVHLLCNNEINSLFLQSEKIMIRVSRQDIIAKHSSLFWYTPEAKKQDISDSLLVETILNYGTLDDYRELVAVLGGKHVAEVFFRLPDGKSPIIIPRFTISFH